MQMFDTQPFYSCGPVSTSEGGIRLGTIVPTTHRPPRRRPTHPRGSDIQLLRSPVSPRAMHAKASSQEPPLGECLACGDDMEPSHGPHSSSGYSDGLAPCKQDALAFDLEAGCGAWRYANEMRPFPWLPWTLFGSKIEQKLRDPDSINHISYKTPPNNLACFFRRFLLFFSVCFFISVWYRSLEPFGLSCRSSYMDRKDEPPAALRKTATKNSLAVLWAETLVTTGACFFLAQGYYGLCSARERMERIRQKSVALAYSFLKTTISEPGVGHGKEELQVLVYECLALLTAFPVTLLEQLRGNNCEPAITSYAHDIAKALQSLRAGDGSVVSGPFYRSEPWVSSGRGHRHFHTVDYYFEVFSLQLQLEYQRQSMTTQAPSLASQQIIYNLRNHFENLADLGNLDGRRTPIIRENIDMLALAGRECSVFSGNDIAPLAFLWSVTIAAWLIAFYNPIQRCETLVSYIPPKLDDGRPRLPTLAVLVMSALATLSATLTTCLTEIWRMWDPFSTGTNTFAWTLGIAMEIDGMLNEFHEHDGKAIIRRHDYMDSSAQVNDAGFAGDEYDDRPRTV